MRYWLFAGDYYYPSGGISDLIGRSDDQDELLKQAREAKHDWWHIVDSETGQETTSYIYDDLHMEREALDKAKEELNLVDADEDRVKHFEDLLSGEEK